MQLTLPVSVRTTIGPTLGRVSPHYPAGLSRRENQAVCGRCVSCKVGGQAGRGGWGKSPASLPRSPTGRSPDRRAAGRPVPRALTPFSPPFQDLEGTRWLHPPAPPPALTDSPRGSGSRAWTRRAAGNRAPAPAPAPACPRRCRRRRRPTGPPAPAPAARPRSRRPRPNRRLGCGA